MEADVKKIRLEIANNSYEVQAAKDMVTKVEKIVATNDKDIKATITPLRTQNEKLD